MPGSFVAESLVGQQIFGTYRLVRLLGKGGMSVVYRARHVLTEQDLAVKVLPPELADIIDVKARFIEEARQAGLSGLRGHRSVGGMRASIYNAFPRSGCEALASFMRDFEARNG